MGAYINPPAGETKEAWLAVYAEPLSSAPTWDMVPKGCFPVCLVSNRMFTAAGIAYDEQELARFSNPDDYRPKQWFFVKRELLYAVSNLKTYLPEENNG